MMRTPHLPSLPPAAAAGNGISPARLNPVHENRLNLRTVTK
jgi:hypothetical protein